MSNMYNVVFGVNPNKDLLLNLLNLQEGHFARFRDIYLDADRNIVVYTRIGGPNRSAYNYIYEELQQHPWYSSNKDDSFDLTYSKIIFIVPSMFQHLIKNIETSIDPEERWKQLSNSIK